MLTEVNVTTHTQVSQEEISFPEGLFSEQCEYGAGLRILNLFSYLLSVSTERHGRVVNTPFSYSVGPGFDYRPRRPAILFEVLCDFPLVPPGECRDSTLQLDHDHFPPNHFQFIIHVPSYQRR
jgi:hypothetical protein